MAQRRSSSRESGASTTVWSRFASFTKSVRFCQALMAIRFWASRTTPGLCGKRSRALRRTQSAQSTMRMRVPTAGCSGTSTRTSPEPLTLLKSAEPRNRSATDWASERRD